MLQNPYVLDEIARTVVLAAVSKHRAYRGWNLLAAHVRSNHVHIVWRSRLGLDVEAADSIGADERT